LPFTGYKTVGLTQLPSSSLLGYPFLQNI
jgi:hypothetical protein